MGLFSRDNLSSGVRSVSSLSLVSLLLATSFLAVRPVPANAITSIEAPRVIFKLGDTPVAVSALSFADVDGDGTKDFVLGRINDRDFFTSTYIVFNKPNLPAVVDLGSLGSLGYRITTSELPTPPTAEIGREIENVGDINGDGREDLLISTIVPKVSGIQYAYLLYGKSDNSEIDVNNLLLSEGTRFKAQVTVNSLYLKPAGVGDINGDNLDDFIFGDFTKNLVRDGTDGQVHVVLGRSSWPAEVDLNNLSGSDGFQINGKTQSQTGYAVSTAGDVNGDGYKDILFTSPRDVMAPHVTEAVYVVFGKQNPQNVSLDTLADQGIRMFSETQHLSLTAAIESLGDINEDGFDDIAIGIHPSFSFPNYAPVITVFGRATAGEINLDTLGTEGSLLTSESSDVSFPIALARSNDYLLAGSHMNQSLGVNNAGVVYGVPLSTLHSSQVLPNAATFAVRGAEPQTYLGATIADGSVNGELLVSVGSGTSNIVAVVVPARDALITLSQSTDAQAPVLGALIWTTNPKPMNSSATLTVSATDNLSGVRVGEYFIGDADPGLGSGTAMGWDGTNLSATFDNSLAAGVHKISVRAEDNAGNWSPVTADYLVVYDPAGPVDVVGRRSLVPSIANGDILPGLNQSGQSDKIIFGFDVRYSAAGGIDPASAFSFTYNTGSKCNSQSPVNCHETSFTANSFNWLSLGGANNSLGTVKGIGALVIDGVSTEVRFSVVAQDGDRLVPVGGDTVTIKIFNLADNPDTATPIYKVSGILSHGSSIKIQ